MDGEVNLEDRAFRPISGHRALDLLATLRDRYRHPIECLRAPTDLDRWFSAVGLRVETRSTDPELNSAQVLREGIFRLVRAALDGTPPPAADLCALNDWARRPGLTPQLARTLEQRWLGGADAALAVIARDAIELLATPDRSLIRECAAAPDCSRIYLDRSPGRRRRWCHMQLCGSTAKMRTYRQHRAATKHTHRSEASEQDSVYDHR